RRQRSSAPASWPPWRSPSSPPAPSTRPKAPKRISSTAASNQARTFAKAEAFPRGARGSSRAEPSTPEEQVRACGCSTRGLQRAARGRTFKGSAPFAGARSRATREEVTMAQAPTLDFEAFVAKRKGERVGGGAETSGHEYAYIMDRQTR